MGFRFRKSVKIAPGVKVNIGKKSTGISIGGKGGVVSINSRTGATARISAPGTGASYATKISSSRKKAVASQEKAEQYDFDRTEANGELSLFLGAEALASLNRAALTEYWEIVKSHAEKVQIGDSAVYGDKLLEEVRLIRAEFSRRGDREELKLESQAPEFNLSTAAGMYEFCTYYEMGFNASKSWALKHFSLIAQELKPGEVVLSVFMGICNYISATKHGYNAAYAITTERILIAQKNFIGEQITSVSIEHVNDVKLRTGLMGGTVTFDAISEKFNAYFNKEIAKRVYDHAQECIRYAKNLKLTSAPPMNRTSADELRDLKGLLDDGIITAEEFEAKKRQLLGL